MISAHNPHKIALCETQPATAEGVRSLIEQAEGLACAWAAPHLPLAVQLARQSRVDVLLLDKHFGQQLVVRAVEELCRDCPDTAVVVWGSSITETEALRYMQAGARGLLRKSASLATIEKCLRTTAQGGIWVDDKVMQAPPERQERGLHQLTPRESQVLELVSRGLRNREIAAALGIRPGTVKIHLKHIFEKTGIHGRYSLALNLMTQKDKVRAHRAEVA
ncbi:MAG: response regulator transcription factor [Bryobacteraceae bacterium]|nr:response regulator transcription factor [Bryobacteraceae bacterium]MCX7602918.1 response regulator transcription factor [Bryobacteraceae bacterium]